MKASLTRPGFFIETNKTESNGRHSLADLRRQAGALNGRHPAIRWLGFPVPGPVLLRSTSEGPCLLAESEVVEPGSSKPGSIVAGLEPVAYDRQFHVLMLTPPGQSVRVNGLPAPRATVLHVTDLIEWDGSTVLHLSLHHQPHLGTPRPEDVGSECLVCRARITEQTVVLVCVHCGLPLHCETTGNSPLECARVSSECPRCRQELVMKEGYAYVPEI
jgi:hypothetical protein